jgi:hypothetical protein
VHTFADLPRGVARVCNLTRTSAVPDTTSRQQRTISALAILRHGCWLVGDQFAVISSQPIAAGFQQRSRGELHVPRSVLEAIRNGEWNYEPELQASEGMEATRALPGTREKLDVLATRLRLGQPLWHPHDRLDYESAEHENRTGR